MIEQEDIPITKEEYFAMVKTISQLRKEKKELIDKVCQWLKEHLLLDDPKWYVEGEKTLQEKMIDDLRKAMEEQE